MRNRRAKKKNNFWIPPATRLFVQSEQGGALVADIAVLVISAEDGIKPQTIETLDCIKKMVCHLL